PSNSTFEAACPSKWNSGVLPGRHAERSRVTSPAVGPRRPHLSGPRRLPGPARVGSPARSASAPRPGPRRLHVPADPSLPDRASRPHDSLPSRPSRAHGPAPAAHAPPQHRALGRYRLRDDSPTRGLVHGTAPFAAVVLEHGPNSVFTRTGALAPGRRGTVAVSPAGHDRGLCAGRCAAGRLLPAGGLGKLGRRRGRRGAVRV